MATKHIDAPLLRRMFIAGARNLEMNKEAVDALNVFPVPDGDTGTNMNLTLQAVVKALDKGDLTTCAQVAQAVATGSLMGARGNSGVILSQLFRGFARAAERKDTMTSVDFALALISGVEIAYKAVGRPVEGTILTVSREAAKTAQNKSRSESDIAKLLTATIEQAERTLAKTPEMLPVLKRAGVVDAGGQGLIHIYRGFLLAVEGKEISAPKPTPAMPAPKVSIPVRNVIEMDTIEFLYCTELLILKPNVEDSVLRQDLEKKGHYDSLLVVGDGDVIKVHVHTNRPGEVLELAIRHGELSGLKIENMKEQHQHTHWAEEYMETPRPGEGKSIGVVAVAAGPGLGDVFRSLGVDVIVEGGQTMNPSTEDLAAAVNSLACDSAVILPNNKNIIMAAEQVKELTSKHVLVVGSRTVPQGLAAMLSYESESTELERVSKAMQRRMNGVKTGQVTYAVKSYSSDVGEIREGDIIGLNDKGIDIVGQHVSDVALQLLVNMVTEDDGIISLFYGADISEKDAHILADLITERFPNCQLDFCSGGQPFYYYIFAVE